MSAKIKQDGISVRIYKRGSETYYCAFRIASRKVQKSTGETSLDRAKASAREIVTEEQRKALLHVQPGPSLTLGQHFDEYFLERVPQLTEEMQQTCDARRALFEGAWGPETLVAEIDQADVDRYVHLRTTGAIHPPGQTAEKKSVSSGTALADLEWLRTAFRWGMKRRKAGEWLIHENPLDRVTMPKRNVNQRRPVASHERYLTTLPAADEIDPLGRIRAMLAIARYTGRRIGSICALRASDILWTTEDVSQALAAMGMDSRLAEHYPQGAIRWASESDKIGQAWITPIAPDLRTELDLYRTRHLAIGDAPLFPAPRKTGEAFDRKLAGRWLVRAETKAELPKLAGGRWHPYRRLFATELAHVPAKTAAMLGGWKNPATMVRLYQQPSGDALYAAANEVGKRL